MHSVAKTSQYGRIGRANKKTKKQTNKQKAIYSSLYKMTNLAP
jgi:hypothetical protein